MVVVRSLGQFFDEILLRQCATLVEGRYSKSGVVSLLREGVYDTTSHFQLDCYSSDLFRPSSTEPQGVISIFSFQSLDQSPHLLAYISWSKF